MLEGDATYLNRSPMCEPQLGRRGLYGSMGGAGESRVHEMALLWVLNLSDGTHSLLDIAERSDLSVRVDSEGRGLLERSALLERDADRRIDRSNQNDEIMRERP